MTTLEPFSFSFGCLLGGVIGFFIAAAPELLEALKVATVWAPHNHDPNADSNGHCPKCNADSAIAKAKRKN